MKTAIVVLSDPKAGDEALGRVFNALAAVSSGLPSLARWISDGYQVVTF